MIRQARASLHVPQQPALKALEQAAVILEVLTEESLATDLLREAQDHVRFTLNIADPGNKAFWLRVLWCVTSQGNA